MFSNYIRYRYISRYIWILLMILILLSMKFRCRRVVLKSNEQFDDYEIPNIVHFITGQGDASDSILDRYGPRLVHRRLERATNEFRLIDYLVLLAVRKHLRPKQIFIHYSYEPHGYWWLKLKHDTELNINFNRLSPIESIFNHPLLHHAHRTDVRRLEILNQYGGIYLDLDVLILKSFARLLKNANQVEAIFAWESQVHQAVSNAIILAPKSSKFLRRMYDSYQSFNSSCWACHSILLLGQLVRVYSQEIDVLPSNSFVEPSWSHVEDLYLRNNYEFDGNYGCHLWNSYVGEMFLKNLTLNAIVNPQRMTTFVRMIHHAVGKDRLTKLLEENF